MKCYIDRLRECPTERLKEMISEQKVQISLANRDLETMNEVLAERTSSSAKCADGCNTTKDNDEKTSN